MRKVRACIGDPEKDEDNPILKAEQAAQVTPLPPLRVKHEGGTADTAVGVGSGEERPGTARLRLCCLFGMQCVMCSSQWEVLSVLHP